MKSQICSRCCLDADVPEISFDENGVCSYCHMFDALCKDSPTGEAGALKLQECIAGIKKNGKGRKYDVLIGFSGGVDSSYLLHIAAENGLRVLAVHISNGYDSDISNSNMENMIEKLSLDVVNISIDQQELNQMFIAFMRAGLPWVDGLTDIAMVSLLYRTAKQHKIKYIWVGNDFRTEGRQPDSWTHIDSRLIRYIWKKFGNGRKIKHFANITPWDMFDWWIIHKIKMVRPLNFMDYNKEKAKALLETKYSWQDYKGHHYENVFTKFILVNWLYEKFNIDKRKITLSAGVRTGAVKREDALAILSHPPVSAEEKAANMSAVMKQLSISQKELDELFNVPNHTVWDYPTYYPMYMKLQPVMNWIFSKVFAFRPMMSYKNSVKKEEGNKHA